MSPKLPDRFPSWSDYGDTHGIDVLPDWWLRCRECGHDFALRWNHHGRLFKGAHLCPANWCNAGRPPARTVAAQLDPDKVADLLRTFEDANTYADPLQAVIRSEYRHRTGPRASTRS